MRLNLLLVSSAHCCMSMKEDWSYDVEGKHVWSGSSTMQHYCSALVDLRTSYDDLTELDDTTGDFNRLGYSRSKRSICDQSNRL